MDTITADHGTLLKQASMTAHEYFHEAIRCIDDQFGKSYAQKHPELIAAFMKVAATDFNTALTAQAIQQAADLVSDAITSQKS